MPFGLANAPATFERLMETVLRGLLWEECLSTWTSLLLEVLWGSVSRDWTTSCECFQAAGLKLKPLKCSFFHKSVAFLGQVVTENGVHTDPEKICHVKKWPVPKNWERSQILSRSLFLLTDIHCRFHTIGMASQQAHWEDQLIYIAWSLWRVFHQPGGSPCISTSSGLPLTSQTIDSWHQFEWLGSRSSPVPSAGREQEDDTVLQQGSLKAWARVLHNTERTARRCFGLGTLLALSLWQTGNLEDRQCSSILDEERPTPPQAKQPDGWSVSNSTTWSSSTERAESTKMPIHCAGSHVLHAPINTALTRRHALMSPKLKKQLVQNPWSCPQATLVVGKENPLVNLLWQQTPQS